MIAQGSEDINAAHGDQWQRERWFPWGTGESVGAWDSLVSVGLAALASRDVMRLLGAG